RGHEMLPLARGDGVLRRPELAAAPGADFHEHPGLALAGDEINLPGGAAIVARDEGISERREFFRRQCFAPAAQLLALTCHLLTVDGLAFAL
ncbi:MAG: hypothetical protein HW418_4037, partial [Anaerolineales bacterium]|nr:hypothetical protein [Anaerolineales bacterium]